MRRFVLSSLLTTCLALAACSGGSSQEVEGTGPWTIEAPASHVTYTTIKAGDLAEPNSFTQMDGSVSPTGAAKVDIFLDSIQTWIDTRDERMRKYVFQTQQFPTATITTQIDMAALESLETGKRTTTESEISVTLAGTSATYDAKFHVTRLGPNRVLIEDALPIMVHADDFGLADGVEKLRELANLETITPVIPVSFSLMFSR